MPRGKHTGGSSGEPRVQVNYIDLFCGCGGFSLGLERAGLSCLAAVDLDPHAVSTFRANFPSVKNVLQEDLTKYTPATLSALIGRARVHAVVGGPPCQGFSRARQVDGSNHGKRLVDDPRRSLYRHFLEYVDFFRPAIFVMENVPGIRSAAGGEFFAEVQVEARKLGYRVHAPRIAAWHYGVPQKRERQLILGSLGELPVFSVQQHMPPTHGDPPTRTTRNGSATRKQTSRSGRQVSEVVSLWEAIGDLPPLAAAAGSHVAEYDLARREAQLARYGGRYLKRVLRLGEAASLTGHVARLHSERDLRDFDRLREGESSKQAIARGERMEFPYDRESFKDRYTRQSRSGLCSTIVAHLSKDGLMFIHPTQRRSLTVREAARVQSFPDTFEFPEARTVAFKLIGNAVPPLLGAAVGRGILDYVASERRRSSTIHMPRPRDPEQALSWLTQVLDVSVRPRALRDVAPADFKRAWYSLVCLHTWLHPDSAIESGGKTTKSAANSALLNTLAPQIALPAYAGSGWPVRLVPLAREAMRRFQEGELHLSELYCSEAHFAGQEWLKRTVANGNKGT